jgi:hypothetical protein
MKRPGPVPEIESPLLLGEADDPTRVSAPRADSGSLLHQGGGNQTVRRRTVGMCRVVRGDGRGGDSSAARARQRPPYLLALLFTLLVLSPYLARLTYPSLYADDILRVAQVRLESFERVLFRPFNEHLAPLHGLITAILWPASGGRLTRIPTAFTLASFVPLPLALGALGRLIRRRTGSITTALAAVAAAGLSWLYLDVVANYSGSGFVWALALTLLAIDAAGRARATALLAALAAPAFSAIGLLAGPAGALGGWFPAEPARRATRLRAVAWPITGTFLYLALGALLRYRDVLVAGYERNANWPTGLAAAARAVAGVLPTSLIGRNLEKIYTSPVGRWDVILAALLLAAALGWATFDPRRRGLVLTGLALIVGGYALTYPVRVGGATEWLLRVDRYHLFPHFGLVLIVAALIAPALRRLDATPRRAWAAGVVVALAFWLSHAPLMAKRMRFYRFPEQARTLAALERVEALARRAGITRAQALAALGVTRTAWLQPERNATTAAAMLGPLAGAARLSDAEARRYLINALSQSEREALWGGLDASRDLAPAPGGATVLAESHPTRAVGLRTLGGGRYTAAGGVPFVEFALPAHEAGVRHLDLPATFDGPTPPMPPLELWWADADGGWSESRSFGWRPDAAGTAIPLERLPHFDPARATRLRIVVRAPGTVTLEPLRLLR